MDYGDYYWGLYKDYHRDPFPHSLLRTWKKIQLVAKSSPKPETLSVSAETRNPKPLNQPSGSILDLAEFLYARTPG